MNYLLQTISLLLISSFVVACATDRIGPEIEKGVKASSIDGDPLQRLLSNEEYQLRKNGHKTSLLWKHRKLKDGTYHVLAEMKVIDTPKLSKVFQWKAQKTTATAADNHWLVKADNQDTKRLVAKAK